MTTLPRILVVDDDAPILFLMKNLLKEFKFDPCTISSGAEALEELQKSTVDLLLVDRHMPGMSGDELIGRVRELGLDVPILVLSGEPMADAEVREIGANGAVLKPFDLADLIGRIRAALPEATVANE